MSENQFALLQLQHAFLDTALHDDAVDKHGLRLSDAVSARRGLLLHGGVPPRVQMDHGIGGGEVQPCATRLEAGQQDRRSVAIGFLKLGDDICASRGWRRTGQHQIGRTEGVEHLRDQAEHRREL